MFAGIDYIIIGQFLEDLFHILCKDKLKKNIILYVSLRYKSGGISKERTKVINFVFRVKIR